MSWLKVWKKYRPNANPFRKVGGKTVQNCVKCYGHGMNRQNCQACARFGANSDCRLCDGGGIVRVKCDFCEGRGWLELRKRKS